MKVYVLELDPAAERRRTAGAGQVRHLAFGFQDLADALVPDRRFRVRVGHLGEVLHGLVHLPQVQDEDHQRSRGKLPAQHHARAEPQHQAGTDGDDDLHQGRQLGLQPARAQRDLDALQALFLQALLLVVLARERLDHADRGQDLLDHGDDLALLLAHFARRLLDAPGVSVHDHKKHRRHGEGDQRKPPVDIEHHADHADQRQGVDENAQEAGGDEALDGVDVAGYAADQVAGLLVIVIGEREPLHVRVQGAPQVVHHPLAGAGGEIFLGVGAGRPENGNHQRGDGGEAQNRQRVGSGGGDHQVIQPAVSLRRARLQHVVEDDLQGPWLEEVGNGFADHRQEPEREGPGMRAQEMPPEFQTDTNPLVTVRAARPGRNSRATWKPAVTAIDTPKLATPPRTVR